MIGRAMVYFVQSYQEYLIQFISMSSQTSLQKINSSGRPQVNQSDKASNYKTEAPQLGVNISFDDILEESLENYIEDKRKDSEDKEINRIEVPILIVHEASAQITQQQEQNYRIPGRFMKKHYNQQRSLTPQRLEELQLNIKTKDNKFKDIQMNNQQSNVVSQGSDETIFYRNLKISKRASYQCKFESKSNGSVCSAHQNYINFSPYLWHNLDDEVSLSDSMKKQRPPLMEHSQLNYESTSSYFPEPTPFRFSDSDFIINRESENKKNIQKQLAFQESSILGIQKKNQHLEEESILEHLEGLKKIEQKPRNKNKNVFYIRDDSSSQEDNQSEKIMKISHKVQENSNVQMSINIDNGVKVDLEPINENIDEGKSLSEMQSQTSSAYQSNLEDYNSQSIHQIQNILTSERSKSTQLIKKTEIHFENIISNLNIEYHEELKAKNKRINELSIDCFEYEERIRQLEIKIVEMSSQSEKTKMQQKPFTSIEEPVNQMTQKIFMQGPSEDFHQRFPHQQEQTKDHFLNNEKMSICIEFLEQSQVQSLDAGTYFQEYCKQLQQLASISEKHLQKNVETIKILQDCLELAIEQLNIKEQKHKFIEDLLLDSNRQNQLLQEEIEGLRQKINGKQEQNKKRSIKI